MLPHSHPYRRVTSSPWPSASLPLPNPSLSPPFYKSPPVNPTPNLTPTPFPPYPSPPTPQSQSYLLSLAFCIAQMLALLYYLASSFPGGTQGVQWVLGVAGHACLSCVKGVVTGQGK